jgi:methionyl-tRNA formyltransferase
MSEQPPLRVIFAGTPDFAIPSLKALIADPGVTVVAVYSQPDRPSGRGRKLTPSPVKACALHAGIPVESPIHFKEAPSREQLAAYAPDLMVVAAYGLLLPQSVLDIPRFGCINVHASLLPRWRGAAPVQAAILAGDAETGVGIMRMEKGLDTGGIYLEKRIAIHSATDAGTLTDDLAQLGAQALIEAIQQQCYTKPAIAQATEGVTYAHKIKKQDALIDWQQPADTVARHIHAYWPWPGAFTFYDGKRLKISAAHAVDTPSEEEAGTVIQIAEHGVIVACGDGALCIETCQPEGKTLRPASQWAPAITIGQQLG